LYMARLRWTSFGARSLSPREGAALSCIKCAAPIFGPAADRTTFAKI
jgi:hypothetical protein